MLGSHLLPTRSSAPVEQTWPPESASRLSRARDHVGTRSARGPAMCGLSAGVPTRRGSVGAKPTQR
eukprot:7499576-Alexandrium_andersonii.AAC.1